MSLDRRPARGDRLFRRLTDEGQAAGEGLVAAAVIHHAGSDREFNQG